MSIRVPDAILGSEILVSGFLTTIGKYQATRLLSRFLNTIGSIRNDRPLMKVMLRIMHDLWPLMLKKLLLAS